ncbi:MAG: prolyl oligopeptidase family serine peptidase [Spirochaetes bacterium]|nr:prolyl oligopeptidase family serine peptidase [Spirochaetota bacterium]
MEQKKKKFRATIKKKVELDYLLYIPKEYSKKPDRKWPLILFLHGSEERGSDLDLLFKNGLPRLLKKRPDFPFIVVSPQCPKDLTWFTKFDDIVALLSKIEADYRVDSRRIYLTGLSMGGDGVWHFAAFYPDHFSAIVPICGSASPFFGFPERVKKIVNIPIWVFHGAKDNIVPVKESKNLVRLLKKYNGNVKFTIYPKAGHDSWTKTYKNEELYKWMLKHKKISRKKDV